MFQIPQLETDLGATATVARAPSVTLLMTLSGLSVLVIILLCCWISHQCKICCRYLGCCNDSSHSDSCQGRHASPTPPSQEAVAALGQLPTTCPSSIPIEMSTFKPIINPEDTTAAQESRGIKPPQIKTPSTVPQAVLCPSPMINPENEERERQAQRDRLLLLYRDAFARVRQREEREALMLQTQQESFGPSPHVEGARTGAIPKATVQPYHISAPLPDRDQQPPRGATAHQLHRRNPIVLTGGALLEPVYVDVDRSLGESTDGYYYATSS